MLRRKLPQEHELWRWSDLGCGPMPPRLLQLASQRHASALPPWQQLLRKQTQLQRPSPRPVTLPLLWLASELKRMTRPPCTASHPSQPQRMRLKRLLLPPSLQRSVAEPPQRLQPLQLQLRQLRRGSATSGQRARQLQLRLQLVSPQHRGRAVLQLLRPRLRQRRRQRLQPQLLGIAVCGMRLKMRRKLCLQFLRAQQCLAAVQ